MALTRAFFRLVLISMVISVPLIQAPPAESALCARTANGAEYESDFDGDHWNDLPVGAPYEDVGSIVDAGSVQVIYGSADRGLTTRDQVFREATDGVPGAAESGDLFGSSMTTGDFDADGYCDLAIGAPAEDEGASTDSGRVWVIYGSSRGLTATRVQSFSQSTPGIGGRPDDGDQFGFSVTAGNFGNGSATDLAIGAPGESIGDIAAAGQVHILYGSGSGLRTANSNVVHQDTGGIKGSAEPGDHFGNVLAAGNLLGSTHAELVIGIPHEDDGIIPDAGAVQYIAGGTNGLTTGDRAWTLASDGISGEPEEGGLFGYSLALGDLGRGPSRDLAIGAPGASVTIESVAYANAGQVHVLYGAEEGPTGPDDLWTQSRANVSADSAPLQSNENDLFGYRLAAGSVRVSTDEVDLIIAVPYEEEHGTDAGVAVVLQGTEEGLVAMTALDPLYYDEELDDEDILEDDRFSFGGLFIRDFGKPYDGFPTVEDISIGTMPKGPQAWGSNFVEFDVGSNGDVAQYWREGYSEMKGEAEPGDRWGWVGNNALHDAIIPGEVPWE